MSERRRRRRQAAGESPFERCWRQLNERTETFICATQPVLQSYAVFHNNPIHLEYGFATERWEYLRRRWSRWIALAEVQSQRPFLTLLGAPRSFFRGAQHLARTVWEDELVGEERTAWMEAVEAFARGLPFVDPSRRFPGRGVCPSNLDLTGREAREVFLHFRERLLFHAHLYREITRGQRPDAAQGNEAEERNDPVDEAANLVDDVYSVDSDPVYDTGSLFCDNGRGTRDQRVQIGYTDHQFGRLRDHDREGSDSDGSVMEEDVVIQPLAGLAGPPYAEELLRTPPSQRLVEAPPLVSAWAAMQDDLAADASDEPDSVASAESCVGNAVVASPTPESVQSPEDRALSSDPPPDGPDVTADETPELAADDVLFRQLRREAVSDTGYQWHRGREDDDEMSVTSPARRATKRMSALREEDEADSEEIRKAKKTKMEKKCPYL